MVLPIKSDGPPPWAAMLGRHGQRSQNQMGAHLGAWSDSLAGGRSEGLGPSARGTRANKQPARRLLKTAHRTEPPHRPPPPHIFRSAHPETAPPGDLPAPAFPIGWAS